MKPKRAWTALLLAILVLLAGSSAYLSLTRIYQVDECQAIYMARVFATGQSGEFFTTSSLFLFGPLSWLSQKAMRSEELFAAARLLFLGVFWLNMFLLAMIVGGRIMSLRGLIALTTAATLAPLWDYGFEIRHDNVVLTGILLIWLAIRTKPMQVVSYLITGAVTVVLLFTAVKTIVYVVPLSFALLVLPPPDFKRPRWQLSLFWLGGALLALAIVRLCYGSGDALENYFSVFREVKNVSADATTRFWPKTTLSRLLDHTPLLVALTTAACATVAWDFWRRRRAALTWETNLPEVLLLLGALTALFINPTPFPYNLIHVVPYAFILAFKYGAVVWNELRSQTRLQPLILGILLFAHIVPFSLASLRHFDRSNSRQSRIMQLAENLTDPLDDPVYDAVGMVPTRPSIHFQWYLHSLNIRGMVKTPGLRVRDTLAARPAAVLIPNYRTDWLPPEDHAFIRSNYIPLADDFWVLGNVLPAGGGRFEIIHPGRYCVVPIASTLSQTENEPLIFGTSEVSGNLDGKAISARPVELGLGQHQIDTSNDKRLAIVWIGPRLSQLPDLGAGNHLSLFVNWY